MSPTLLPPPAAPFVPAVTDDILYEIIDGHRVEIPPMSVYGVRIASILQGYLEPYGNEKNVGQAVVEMLFILNSARRLQQRPDLAFVTFQRWPRGRSFPSSNAWDVVPDLAVEVVSPTNDAEELLSHILEYFAAGTQRVWVIYPRFAQIYVYSSPTQIQVLTLEDELRGDPILPGFRLPVANLFPNPPAVSSPR